MQQNLETFLAEAAARERCVPSFVEREFRKFLACGLLCHGFVRVRCTACGDDRIVAFSCQRRGFCPSCCGRRMADTAAHLVDRVFPEVPTRQWVLTLPIPLRYRVAYDRDLCSDVLGVFIRTVLRSLRHRAKKLLGIIHGRSGSVTQIQRWGGAVNLNVHFHSIFLDGVYADPDNTGTPEFFPLPAPDDDESEHEHGCLNDPPGTNASSIFLGSLAIPKSLTGDRAEATTTLSSPQEAQWSSLSRFSSGSAPMNRCCQGSRRRS
ncbi:MAG: transposase zinc-binding domain-containing protein [Deltaproteobacteria bacterium]|nr:transposase zinc-binding domain-containing protein [Deltaproteobacteria bacterium]